MALPTDRKPTASEVVNWAESIIGQRIDVPGSGYGAQCWDLPNYLFNRYWGFRTPGNARDMVYYHFPPGFKVLRNTEDFVPLPGDIGVWTQGNYNWNVWGHTDIVIGPATKDYFYGVDQNWFNSNEYSGSPAAKVKHTYFGVTHFIRPAYKEEPRPVEKKVDEVAENKIKAESNKVVYKEINKIYFTISGIDYKNANEFIHFIDDYQSKAFNTPKKVVIKNVNTVLSTLDMYHYRKKLNYKKIPHIFVDRFNVWFCKPFTHNVFGYDNAIVVSVCEGEDASNDMFKINEIEAIRQINKIMERFKLKDNDVLVDSKAWRTIELHSKYDIIADVKINQNGLVKVKDELFKLYADKDKYLNSIPKDIIEKVRIKTIVKDVKTVDNKEYSNKNNNEQKVDSVFSEYSLNQAINIQFSLNPPPQTNNGYSWYNASREQTRKSMDTNLIFDDNVQKYQLLKLDKYQGIPVAKLNQILSDKGTLSGKGQAFSDGCKAYGVNEVYLIAHAFLESNYGRSNFASGTYGIYNYFGIGAFDSNTSNAITFARNQGWTTPESAIKGGAKFVGRSYFDVGQNTLYRMRWNPLKPGNHQYATDISWAKIQAQIISELYNKIGLSGEYFIYDKYK
nr:MAG TPA: Endolysin [Caudoviricetes sp.]